MSGSWKKHFGSIFLTKQWFLTQNLPGASLQGQVLKFREHHVAFEIAVLCDSLWLSEPLSYTSLNRKIPWLTAPFFWYYVFWGNSINYTPEECNISTNLCMKLNQIKYTRHKNQFFASSHWLKSTIIKYMCSLVILQRSFTLS